MISILSQNGHFTTLNLNQKKEQKISLIYFKPALECHQLSLQEGDKIITKK